MKMALFVLITLIISYFPIVSSLLGSENNNIAVLEIRPSRVTGGQKDGFYRVEDTLNLTCVVKNETFLPDAVLGWFVPTKALNSQNRVVQKPGANFVILTIENLQENDSGEYKCRAFHNSIPVFNLENTIRINVKSKKKECTDVMFQCSAGICISKRYTCDGKIDCPNGEDESPNYCGPGDPCDKKFMCPEKRCIPFAWCCELHREPNCTIKVKHSCCNHVKKLTRDVDNDLGYRYEQQRFSDMGFLQTTVYTVIGCAMAFMFIVTIIVIAICRVHTRRTLFSRCPGANRNLTFPRGGSNIHENQLNGLSFYDLDLYFNRSRLAGNDLMSVNPLLVTYNIDNGVQFVGRPIDPPPYCEIVRSPPKEGPPPPYASNEDLTVRTGDGVEEPKEEELPEVTESDALLGVAASESVRVISCNATDVVPPLPGAILNAETDLDESEVTSVRHENTVSKESSEPVVNNDASRCDGGFDKDVDSSRNFNVDIVVLRDPDSGNPENLKFQSGGESSSYVTEEVTDVSRGP